MKVVKDVDEYIALAPKEVQGKLKELRGAIKTAVPNAEERISYHMPFYIYKGRLVYFAFAKKHIGVYAINAPVIKEYENEVDKYLARRGTIQLPLDEKLPLALIKKLVKAQVKKNDESKKGKERMVSKESTALGRKTNIVWP